MKNHSLILFLILIIMIPCFHCTIINVAGGSSSTDNGKITGFVSLDNNMPASNTLVTLRLADFDPCSDTIVPGVDTTDADGKYEFTSLQSGIYTIEAVATGGKRALVTSVMVDTSSTHVAAVSLAQPGRIEVLIPECAAESNCYVYIPGTSCFGEISNGIAYLDSVPAGYIPALYYVNQKNRSNHSVKNGISLAEGETKVIADYSAWKYSRKIGLNTTRDGADIAGNIYQFPVLIRLANDNFDFERALPDGSDIRFKKADDTPIPFEIERWDRENKRAEIWVIIDTVYGYNEGQYFLMYWGNSSADAVTSGNPVFDTARGFQGVWHLAEPGGTTTFDATCNGYNGTPFGMLSLSSVSGVIGKAIDFDGKGSYIVMRNTAESKINFPEDQRYSISLWAYADTIDTVWHSIASKGHRQYYLQYKCFHDTAASWEFVEYQNGGGGITVNTKSHLLPELNSGSTLLVSVTGSGNVCMSMG